MSEISNPHAARPAFAIGDRVEVFDGSTTWFSGTVKRVYQVSDQRGMSLWVYDVAMDYARNEVLAVTHARRAP